jgi:putative oxygen-independent coproporphyrinogen III oxidase
MARASPPLSLYIHLPWCVRKCPYCDFNSHRAGDDPPWDRYVAAIVADIGRESHAAGDRIVESIFIGGGTPSLFSADRIGAIIEASRQHCSLAPDCEVTMEANPGTVEHGSLRAYRDAGVTRLSIGAQSFDPAMLGILGRIHGPNEIVATCEEAKEAGFASINVDVMFGLPGQDVDKAVADLVSLIRLSPPHISWYQLTLEPNTVFHQRPPDGIPDEDLAWEIQLAGNRLLADAGYDQYEISAFARPGHRCRHNLNYWQFGDYLAVGAGAHGKLTGDDGSVSRYRKPANPLVYMEQVESGRIDVARSPVGDQDLGFEFMLNALRLMDGVPLSMLGERTGLEADSLTRTISAAVDDGLLEDPAGGVIRPTQDGFRLLNELQARFLP